jgi:hypothetical protein
MSNPAVPTTIPVIPPIKIPTKKVNKNKEEIEKNILPVCRVTVQLCIFNVEGILTNKLVAENIFFIFLFKPPIYIWCPQTIIPRIQIANILITIWS